MDPVSGRIYGLDPEKNCQDRADGQRKGRYWHIYKVELLSPWMVKLGREYPPLKAEGILLNVSHDVTGYRCGGRW